MIGGVFGRIYEDGMQAYFTFYMVFSRKTMLLG